MDGAGRSRSFIDAAEAGTFRALLDAAPFGNVIVDEQGTILYANDALCVTFGYELEVLLGAPVHELLPTRFRADHRLDVTSYMKDPLSRTMGPGRDLVALHADGREFPVEIALTPLRRDGQLVVLASVHDITERVRLANLLHESNARLEEFSHAASHDLRAPLRGIVSLVEWIEEDLGTEAPEPVLRNLERIRTRVENLDRITRELLAYAKAGAGAAELSRVEPDALIAGVLASTSIPDGLRVEVDDRGARPFPGARTPLETVLRNLLSNAVRHHDRPDGLVRITAEDRGAFCVFGVEDDGPGVPPHARDRIFHMFQTHGGTAGTGVGLALALRMAESHGGTLRLDSTFGPPGARFEVIWPRHRRKDRHDR